MSDGLDITAGIIAVLQLTQEVIQYLLEVKDGNADRQRILNEITSVHGFLYILKNKAESSSVQSDTTLYNTLRTLNATNGPLDQFKFACERVASKVRPERCAKKAHKALRSALKALPKGLDETYEDVLRSIDSQHSEDADVAKQVLLWITSVRNFEYPDTKE
jgi:hypothetical protein